MFGVQAAILDELLHVTNCPSERAVLLVEKVQLVWTARKESARYVRPSVRPSVREGLEYKYTFRSILLLNRPGAGFTECSNPTRGIIQHI